ncbi:Fur family transcriptional regulator [Reinekea blandensis]|uniref:Fe2+/Zn2+ uptake regulation protein n=1 Tax=Reinekea blandensis MED297 TaxID=314283 RepID=A4BAY6_9GAMM|nr:transcriptional repressor [Reinekea blandensis]EAR10599.1 Fe2+/Zn2+ uptake regulation protein [Reinekea sp. MED297] [Reinekea blandensis MED297]
MSIPSASSRPDIHKDVRVAEHQCQVSGRRLTIKRRQLLVILLEQEKAVSAYELIDCYYQKHHERLPPTSIYRMLEFLEQEQLAHKLKLANKYVACAHIAGCGSHHAPQFLICSHCYRVKEVILSDTAMADLKAVSAAAGFKMEAPQLEISCVCFDCQSKLR